MTKDSLRHNPFWRKIIAALLRAADGRKEPAGMYIVALPRLKGESIEKVFDAR